ncbi:hypothetical protein ACF1A5_15760 [Streptomyces sp. NPDC014864]
MTSIDVHELPKDYGARRAVDHLTWIRSLLGAEEAWPCRARP